MTKITEIEGIGSTYAQKLAGIGISTPEGLLKQGATKKGRKEIAEKKLVRISMGCLFISVADKKFPLVNK